MAISGAVSEVHARKQQGRLAALTGDWQDERQSGGNQDTDKEEAGPTHFDCRAAKAGLCGLAGRGLRVGRLQGHADRTTAWIE